MEASDDGPAGQFHFDPETYADLMRSEVPSYLELQDATAAATTGLVVKRVLDLGVGTGETLARVRVVHPGAQAIGIDESEPMLEYARRRLPGAELSVGRLEDRLPEGSYDLVVSALAVHHLDDDAKADLFGRVAARLRSKGRFVLADIVVPDDAAELVTPIEDGYDKPSPIADQLDWLAAAGLTARVSWAKGDLVVISADRP
ncbi:MAG: class I SAM-dependent methyltransferase [Acidimicrobiales bacterium]|jgi:tRNA (cmo5U34)-methyltransferase